MGEGPFYVKEDDEVDNLDIKLDVKKKSTRVYRTSPEVSLKISRALKSLNAKTGLFTKRMKMIHSNPTLHAQRVAAIKKVRGTPAARKRTSEVQKAFFSDLENRRKRSTAMKDFSGIKFYCSYCGREGHRRHYCPELKDSLIDRRFRCRVCGEKGHNRRTCSKLVPIINHPKATTTTTRSLDRRFHRCRMCGQHGHNQRSCPKKKKDTEKEEKKVDNRRTYTCRLCKQKGHNTRTCPTRTADDELKLGDKSS